MIEDSYGAMRAKGELVVANQYLTNIQNWLGHCAEQYCLTNPWGANTSPLDMAVTLSRFEFLTKNTATPRDIALPGREITIFDYQTHEEAIFTLVSPEDSQPEKGRLSILSPLGSQMLGRTAGDLVEVQVFGRGIRFRIINIKHADDDI